MVGCAEDEVAVALLADVALLIDVVAVPPTRMV